MTEPGGIRLPTCVLHEKPPSRGFAWPRRAGHELCNMHTDGGAVLGWGIEAVTTHKGARLSTLLGRGRVSPVGQHGLQLGVELWQFYTLVSPKVQPLWAYV